MMGLDMKSTDDLRKEMEATVRACGVETPMDLVAFFRLSDPDYAAQLETLVNQLWTEEVMT